MTKELSFGRPRYELGEEPVRGIRMPEGAQAHTLEANGIDEPSWNISGIIYKDNGRREPFYELIDNPNNPREVEKTTQGQFISLEEAKELKLNMIRHNRAHKSPVQHIPLIGGWLHRRGIKNTNRQLWPEYQSDESSHR